MILRVEALNDQRVPDSPPLKIGIGIHSALLTAGNVGARDRIEYSVIGETVNLASRLEALTKDFNVGIVMSPQTQQLVESQFETVLLGETEIRGFPDKARVYSVANKGPTEANS
jgi:adenylate cyclase